VLKPLTSDPLFTKVLESDLSDAFIKTLEKTPHGKLNFKLKTRLLMEDDNPVASRCQRCQAILI
jgi:hypothetical protein